MFLFGPRTLWNNMVHPTRRAVTITFFTAMAISIFACLFLKNQIGKLITLLAVGVQMAAYWWYSISYIPFGRQIVTKCCQCLYKGLETI